MKPSVHTENGGSVEAPEAPEQLIERLGRKVDLLTEREKLLMAENLRLAEMLKAKGIAVPIISRASMDLPPPIEKPMAREGRLFAAMLIKEKELLREVAGETDLFFMVKSETVADVGQWFSKAPVWVCATGDELVLLAAGRRAHVEKVAYRFLGESLYNHVTGEVVFAPAREMKLHSVAMSPVEGYQLLAQIYRGAAARTRAAE